LGITGAGEAAAALWLPAVVDAAGIAGAGGGCATAHCFYKAEGLMVRRLKRKRLSRTVPVNPLPVRPNQEWGMDFVSDTLAKGRALRMFTLIDNYTKESLAIEADTGISSRQVTPMLERVIEECGGPDDAVEASAKQTRGDQHAEKCHTEEQIIAGKSCRRLFKTRCKASPAVSAGEVGTGCISPHAFLYATSSNGRPHQG
jgi:hypothetical protein